VSPVRYELGFYIPEYDILHSDGMLRRMALVRTDISKECIAYIISDKNR
jgi:hypothetical protein